MKIEDNFLDQKKFDEIQTLMMGGGEDQQNLPWFFASAIDTPEEFHDENIDKFQFTHMFYFDFCPKSPFCERLNPVIGVLNPISIFRIKAYLLTRAPNIIENEFHTDIGDLHPYPEKLKQWTTAILYMNTNNGRTEFKDGTIIESVANRLAVFPSNLEHRGTTCTDEKTRVVINFNYFSTQ